MPQKPLSEMADTGYENMSEEAGYVLHEWKTHAIVTDTILESKADKSEFYDFVNYADSKLQCRDEYVQTITALSDKLDACIAALKAMADKVDAEDVTNLDTDYRAVVDALIK